MSHHQVADLCAQWQSMQTQENAYDPMLEVGVGENIYLARENNWVAQDIWGYLKQRVPSRLAQNRYDLLEVYCSPDSELTSQARAQGLLVDRFGLKDGDLSTAEGRYRLYDRMIHLLPIETFG